MHYRQTDRVLTVSADLYKAVCTSHTTEKAVPFIESAFVVSDREKVITLMIAPGNSN